MFFIQQASKYDCGFTALKILLANIHHDSNYLFLTTPFEKDCSFLDLMKEANKYQVELEPLKTDTKEGLREYKQLPFIARIGFSNVHHAVYVYKLSKKYVYYYDPHKGKEKIPYDEFITIWTGEILSIKNYVKHPCPVSKPKFMKMSETIISLLMSLVSAVSSVLSIYFINKDSYIYLPIIFFTVSILSIIILKKYSMYVMKAIDKRVEELVGDIKNKDYKGFYVDYEAYKKSLLINNLSTFSSFAVFIIISLVFIINDKMNFIYVLTNLLLAFVYVLMVKPLLDKDESEIKENEEKIELTTNKLEAFSYMNMARDKAYKYVDKFNGYQYVVIMLQVVLTFILMIYNQLVSVTYLVCYSFLEIYLYKNVVSLLTSNEEFNKQDNLLNKLNNLIINK